MADPPNQRQARRIALPARPAAAIRLSEPVRLLDVSLTGARLEHEQLLRPGRICTIEFPASLGGFVLTAQVVWSQVVSTVPSAGGRLLRYESGLQFPPLTPEQQRALGQALKKAERDLEKGGHSASSPGIEARDAEKGERRDE